MSGKKWLALVVVCGMGYFLSSCATTGVPRGEQAARAYSHYMKGLLSDRSDDIDAAVAYYKKAQAVDRQAPVFHLQLGLDYIRLKKYKEAVSEFESIIRATPDDENARYVLALLYIQFNDFKSAAGQYESVLAKDLGDRKQNIQLRRILSQLYFLQKDLARARQHGAKILELDPVDEFGLYLVAMLDNEEGRSAVAEEGFKKVLTYYPEHADAMNALAYLYAEQNIHLDRALDLAEKAVAYDPSEGAYQDTLGWVYFKIGEADKAIEYLTKASQLMFDPVILEHLADAYHKKGMLKEEKEVRDRLKHLNR